MSTGIGIRASSYEKDESQSTHNFPHSILGYYVDHLCSHITLPKAALPRNILPFDIGSCVIKALSNGLTLLGMAVSLAHIDPENGSLEKALPLWSCSGSVNIFWIPQRSCDLLSFYKTHFLTGIFHHFPSFHHSPPSIWCFGCRCPNSFFQHFHPSSFRADVTPESDLIPSD